MYHSYCSPMHLREYEIEQNIWHALLQVNTGQTLAQTRQPYRLMRLLFIAVSHVPSLSDDCLYSRSNTIQFHIIHDYQAIRGRLRGSWSLELSFVTQALACNGRAVDRQLAFWTKEIVILNFACFFSVCLCLFSSASCAVFSERPIASGSRTVTEFICRGASMWRASPVWPRGFRGAIPGPPGRRNHLRVNRQYNQQLTGRLHCSWWSPHTADGYRTAHRWARLFPRLCFRIIRLHAEIIDAVW